MMRSLYSGVSGLRTHQVKMDVIGNNIANVNTTAFKSSSITFNELMSQTTQRASGPNALTGTGGTNARQIGLGVRSGAISMAVATQGASQSTGNPFDLMITGNALFVVNNGQENFFTRDGSFYVDAAGNLAMTSTGYNVMGWAVDEATQTIKKDTVSALRVMSNANMTYPPEATTSAVVSGIIDMYDTEVTSTTGRLINLNFYDALGYTYTAKFAFKQSGGANYNEYSVELVKLLDSRGNEIDISDAELFGTTKTQTKPGTVNLIDTGYQWTATSQLQDITGNVLADLSLITAASELSDIPVAAGTAGNPLAGVTVGKMLDNIAAAYGYESSTEEFLNLCQTFGPPPVTIRNMIDDNSLFGTATIDFEGRQYVGTAVTYDKSTGKFTGLDGAPTQTKTVLDLNGLVNGGENFRPIEIDFSLTSMIDNKGTSNIGADRGDINMLNTGRRVGEMISISIQNDGMIYASYSNGMTKLLGQIAVAEFANMSGLEKKGDNLYSATLNSGEFDGIGTDIKLNGGYMSSGQLEMSNVDLSMEFTEMITTQRGFQANSRIITVSDTLLEELTNLKR